MRIALLAALLIAFSAEAQTYSKIVSEGTAVSAPVVTIPAGQTYRWGIGTKWCDPVTVSVATTITAYNFQLGTGTPPVCKVDGVATVDVDPNVIKELDGLETATAWIASVVTPPATDPLAVTVPAIAGTLRPPASNSVTFTMSLSFQGVPVSATCTAVPVVTK